MRWKAAKLEDAIVAELESMRIRDEGHAQLIRNTLTAAFADVVKLEADRRRILAKLRREIRGRLDRLMYISLDGTIQQGGGSRLNKASCGWNWPTWIDSWRRSPTTTKNAVKRA